MGRTVSLHWWSWTETVVIQHQDEGSEVADGLDVKSEEKGVSEDEGLEQLSESPTSLLPKTLETLSSFLCLIT